MARIGLLTSGWHGKERLLTGGEGEELGFCDIFK
jgi:hypothetical protein